MTPAQAAAQADLYRLLDDHGELGVVEARYLLERIEAGEIDGGDYGYDDAPCACVLGSMTRGRNADRSPKTAYLAECWSNVLVRGTGHGLSPLERLVRAVRPPQTHLTSEPLRLVHAWASAWLAAHAQAVAG